MKDFLDDFTKGCISTAESVSYYAGYSIYMQKIELGNFNIDEVQEELDEILEGE